MDFYQAIEEITAKDLRYKKEAFEFVMQALMFTQRTRKKPGHVCGRELSEGVRDLSIEQYGPMARHVLERWGITRTEDIGAIVYLMVARGLMSTTDGDDPKDFNAVYDFREAFDVFKRVADHLT